MAIDIGRIAFQAHEDYLNKDNYREPELWEEIGKGRQDAWRAAGVAIIQHIDQERADLDADSLELDLTID